MSNTQVSKEAREAAAGLIEWQQRLTAEWEQEGKPVWQFFAAGFPDGIRKGVWDEHDVVQAFQRAIDQSALAEREACAKVAEADGGTTRYGTMDFGPNVARRIATAIRERKV